MSYIFTSESVTEGHPDKVCDFVADRILDAHLTQDPRSRVACEVLAKSDRLVLAGEISSHATVDVEAVARQAVRDIGYTDPEQPFNADGIRVDKVISQQAPEIAQGVDKPDQGAGDQGLMFGYACDETPELMPLPIVLAHKLAKGLADDRRGGRYPWLRPDGKTQVAVWYANGRPAGLENIVVSTQHAPDVTWETVNDYVREDLAPRILGDWFTPTLEIFVNPTGSFVQGGPSADCGVTGRKIIVDTYGGMARHGGGAFSGKDPTKVDRSGAYFARFVARQVVANGLALRAEVQVAYAIGVADPVSIAVNTFGTGDQRDAWAFVNEHFCFQPAAILERLRLRRPIYAATTNYGHFGRPGFPWEETVPVRIAGGGAPALAVTHSPIYYDYEI